MEVFEYLRILRKHKRMLILLCGSSVFATLLLIRMLSGEKYEAKALILIRPPTQNIKLATKQEKELLNFPVGTGGKIEAASNTYIEVIKSRAMAEQVVRLLRLDVEKPKAPAKTYFERALSTFMESIGRALQLLKYGRVIGKPPPLEGAVGGFQSNISLAAISDSYLFEVKYAGDSPQEAAEVVNVTVDLFVQYMATVDSPDAKRKLLFIEERLRQSERDLLAGRERLRQFKQKKSTVSFREEASEGIKMISSLESDLEKTEVKLAGLLKELTPSNPKVQVLQAEKDRLVAALVQRKSKMDSLPETEKQLAGLSLDVKAAEEVYELINKEYEEVRLRAGEAVSEIRVVSSAVPPIFPVGRARSLYLVGALCMSLLVGLGLVFLREYLDAPLETVEGVQRALQLPVLATVPQMGLSSKPGHSF